MISAIYSIETIGIVMPYPNVFFWIATSAADATVVNPNDIKTLLANGLIAFLIKNNPCLTKTSPHCAILCKGVFDNFILAQEPLVIALWSLETCVLVNNNLCWKLFSSLEWQKIIDGSFEVTPVPFFIPYFNLLSFELDSVTFKVLYWDFWFWYYIKTK